MYYSLGKLEAFMMCIHTYDEHLVSVVVAQAVALAVPSVPCTHLIAESEMIIAVV